MTNWRDESKIEINPSWVLQTLVLGLLGISGWFIAGDLTDIKDEMRLSRIERGQLRADLSALEVGLRGDRFSRTDWERERDKLSEQIEEIKERLRELKKAGR
jgi:hypothetical protein